MTGHRQGPVIYLSVKKGNMQEYVPETPGSIRKAGHDRCAWDRPALAIRPEMPSCVARVVSFSITRVGTYTRLRTAKKMEGMNRFRMRLYVYTVMLPSLELYL